MRVYIVVNENKSGAADAASRLRGILRTAGIEESVSKNDADVIVALGGDGTILAQAGSCQPVLGINLGRLGYMTGLETAEMHLAALLGDGETFETVERMMLDAEVIRDGEVIRVGSALNEAVITRSGLPQLADLELRFDGQIVATYSADGLIVATPTGSTAYSMSAGGPLADPRLNIMIVTPICPHNPAKSRALVTSGDTVTEVIPLPSRADGLCLSLDGHCEFGLRCGDRVRLKRSLSTTKLVKLRNKSFGSLLYVTE